MTKEPIVAGEELSIANIDPAASPIDATTIEGEVKEIKPGADGSEGEPKPEEKPEVKPEKTEAERIRDKMQRGIDRRTRQLEEARAETRLLREQLTRDQNSDKVSTTADDSEPLSLTRAQLDELVESRAAKLAPTLRDEAAEVQRRKSVVQSLAETWGQKKFDELSSELDEAFGGLTDSSGRPKPAIEAVFEADAPAKVIEWLADPENIDEAERISKLNPVQAGKAIAKLEARMSTETPKPKTVVSKAPAPLESVRGQGPSSPLPQDSDSTEVWLEKERARMKAKGITRYG